MSRSDQPAAVRPPASNPVGGRTLVAYALTVIVRLLAAAALLTLALLAAALLLLDPAAVTASVEWDGLLRLLQLIGRLVVGPVSAPPPPPP